MCPKGARKKVKMKGIDVSAHNGAIFWPEVKKAGIEFVMLRAGFGYGNGPDASFKENIDGALAAGLHVGVYWFQYSKDTHEAVKEAEECLKLIEPYRGRIEFPICADFEYDTENWNKANRGVSYTPRLRTDIVKAFLERIESAGWAVANYTNLDYLKNRFIQADLEQYDLWLASWPSVPIRDFARSRPMTCEIWQYSAKGAISGIPSSARYGLDMDYCYKDYPAFVRLLGLNGYSAASAEPKTYDITIPCASEEERQSVLKALKKAR